MANSPQLLLKIQHRLTFQPLELMIRTASARGAIQLYSPSHRGLKLNVSVVVTLATLPIQLYSPSHRGLKQPAACRRQVTQRVIQLYSPSHRGLKPVHQLAGCCTAELYSAVFPITSGIETPIKSVEMVALSILFSCIPHHIGD